MGGAAGVSWCLAPSDLLFLRRFHTQMDVRTHREPCVRFTISTFHLGSTSPACACCLRLLCLFSPVHADPCPSLSFGAGTETPAARLLVPALPPERTQLTGA